MKIAIDAGHGPNTAGKRAPDGSMREFEFNSAVAGYAVELLSRYQNAETLKVYDEAVDTPLGERTARANEWGADILVSIHANAAGANWSDAAGIETYVYSTRPPESVRLAEHIQEELVARTGLRNRGVKAANFHMLRESRMPAVLAECGFMTNREELALLKSDTYRRTCAAAIVAGIAKMYGLLPKQEVKPVRQSGDSEDAAIIEEPTGTPTVQRAVDVVVDGEPAGSGYLIDNVSYVPARQIAELFGASVGWDGERVIIIRRDS